MSEMARIREYAINFQLTKPSNGSEIYLKIFISTAIFKWTIVLARRPLASVLCRNYGYNNLGTVGKRYTVQSIQR